MNAYTDYGQWGKYHTTLANLYKSDARHLLLGKRSGRGTEFSLGENKQEQLDTLHALIWSLEAIRKDIQAS